MMKSSLIHLLVLLFGVVCLLGTSDVPVTQRLRVEWDVPITGPEGGHLTWYQIKVDPENGDNLIVCGMIRNANDNAYYGVVYASHDEGRSWKLTFEDRHSTWVSEVSCTFGEHHKVYLVSEASRAIDEDLHHDLGTARIFTSSNAGGTWLETGRTGWADYSTSVVAKFPGRTEQLYVFYNGANDQRFVSQAATRQQLGVALDFFTVSEDGRRIGARQSVAGMTERNYIGLFPSSSVTLNDGSLAVLYNAAKLPAGSSVIDAYDIGVARVSADGTAVSTIIATASVKLEPRSCPNSFSNSLAYDKYKNILYTAFNDASPGHCALMITSSRDGGLTWSSPHEVYDVAGSRVSAYFPIIAINNHGVIGIMWSGKAIKSVDCWNFSTLNSALNLDDTVSLSPCPGGDSFKQQSSAYLSTVITNSSKADPSASIQVNTYRDYLTRASILSTPDGAFHPVWPEIGDGFGELRTATIWRGIPPQSQLISPLPGSQLMDITDKVSVLYGGQQRIDRKANSVTIRLSIRNNGAEELKAPIYAEVVPVSSDFGKVAFLQLAESPLGSNYVDLTPYMPHHSLGAKAKTLPFPLVFRITDQTAIDSTEHQQLRQTVVDVKLRFFSCAPAR